MQHKSVKMFYRYTQFLTHRIIYIFLKTGYIFTVVLEQTHCCCKNIIKIQLTTLCLILVPLFYSCYRKDMCYVTLRCCTSFPPPAVWWHGHTCHAPPTCEQTQRSQTPEGCPSPLCLDILTCKEFVRQYYLRKLRQKSQICLTAFWHSDLK